jgi:hypothetical protein
VFRDSVSDLFHQIEKSKKNQVVLDFSHVKSISRSFAQEYLEQKKKHTPLIDETNMSPEIKKMFAAINKHQKKPFPLSFDDAKEISISDFLQQNEKRSIK